MDDIEILEPHVQYIYMNSAIMGDWEFPQDATTPGRVLAVADTLTAIMQGVYDK